MKTPAEKLKSLRATLQEAGVDGFIVPVSDEFLGEYVPDSAQRLAWLSGFTGSAGMAVVLRDRAALFVDGRYTLQARQQVDEDLYECLNSSDRRPDDWLAEHLPEDGVLGIDPLLHSIREVEKLEKALKPRNIRIAYLSDNPIDMQWDEQPLSPTSEPHIHEQQFAGESHAEKRLRIGEAVRKAGADVAFLVATDSVNWLLNIRGRDVPFSPLLLAYARIDMSGHCVLYLAPERVTPILSAHLAPDVSTHSPGQIAADLVALGASGAKVLLDPALTPIWFAETLSRSGAELVLADDPCQKPKAVKNETELDGIRAAHIRDGVALTQFLCWLQQEVESRDVTELEVMDKVLAFRKAAEEFVSPSFETIAGSGPNGAIVHYRATPETNRSLKKGELFLLDSGGQYPDGTTDVTRTVAVGEPNAEQRQRFTLVLKGHIAIATVRFPEGTSGSQLDVLARHALWQHGFDYDHGTGHGVGQFLNVHEGPQRISKRAGDAVLVPGMIVSNEPGYYREDAYGIRIESLVEVVPAGKSETGKRMLGFSTLTCAPIDRRLIDPALLTDAETAWINEYHAWVRNTLSPRVDENTRAWLAGVTQPMG